jgi:hypothetical protein
VAVRADDERGRGVNVEALEHIAGGVAQDAGARLYVEMVDAKQWAEGLPQGLDVRVAPTVRRTTEQKVQGWFGERLLQPNLLTVANDPHVRQTFTRARPFAGQERPRPTPGCCRFGLHREAGRVSDTQLRDRAERQAPTEPRTYG